MLCNRKFIDIHLFSVVKTLVSNLLLVFKVQWQNLPKIFSYYRQYKKYVKMKNDNVPLILDPHIRDDTFLTPFEPLRQ